MTTSITINHNNINAYFIFLKREIFPTFYRWDKISEHVQISYSLYHSTACNFIADSGVGWDSEKHNIINVFNNDPLPGNLFRIATYDGKPLAVVIVDNAHIKILALNGDNRKHALALNMLCKHLTQEYNQPVTRINSYYTARCIIQVYSGIYTPSLYPIRCRIHKSKSAKQNEVIVTDSQRKVWSEKRELPYTSELYTELTQFNNALVANNHIFTY